MHKYIHILLTFATQLSELCNFLTRLMYDSTITNVIGAQYGSPVNKSLVCSRTYIP